MVQLTCHISNYHDKMIKDYAYHNKMAVYRVGSLLVTKQLCAENPFDFGLTLPDEYVSLAYANEANPLLEYLRRTPSGKSLDDLVVHRHDIGVPDQIALLTIISECVDIGVIEQVEPPYNKNRGPVADDFYYYRIPKGPSSRTKKKEANEYDTFLKLKKKYGKEA